jgi:DNA-binding NtrC family response regulator
MFSRKLPIRSTMLHMPELVPAKPRLLVADGNDVLRLTLREHFESAGLTVASARNGKEAIALLEDRKTTFDIVFTDLMMAPGPSGIDVLRVAQRIHPPCQVVVMTTSSSLEAAIQAIDLGAFDYVAKPFRLEEAGTVLKRVREHLNLLDDNKRLSRRIETLTDRFSTIGSRLDRIETMLGRLTGRFFSEGPKAP